MKLSSVLTAAASTLAVATIGYAVYFDYKRRNDPDFRKKLRKQSKQSVKVAKKELKAAAQQESMMIEKAVREVFDLRPLAIINDLDLRRPVYKKTAAHGHFGRNEPEFTWERLDRVEALRSAVSAS